MWYLVAGIALGVAITAIGAFLGLCMWEWLGASKDRVQRILKRSTKDWIISDKATFVEPHTDEEEEVVRRIAEKEKRGEQAKIEDIY